MHLFNNVVEGFGFGSFEKGIFDSMFIPNTIEMFLKRCFNQYINAFYEREDSSYDYNIDLMYKYYHEMVCDVDQISRFGTEIPKVKRIKVLNLSDHDKLSLTICESIIINKSLLIRIMLCNNDKDYVSKYQFSFIISYLIFTLYSIPSSFNQLKDICYYYSKNKNLKDDDIVEEIDDDSMIFSLNNISDEQSNRIKIFKLYEYEWGHNMIHNLRNISLKNE